MSRPLFSRLFARRAPQGRSPQSRLLRQDRKPRLETLEDRLAPAIGLGSLAAPTGTFPTGAVLNPTHWKVLQNDTITGTIIGATDAFDTNGDGYIQVQIQSSHFGNTVVDGTLSGNTITFTWTVQPPGGSDEEAACGTTIVSYEANVSGGYLLSNNNLAELAFFGSPKPGFAAAGYAVVDSNGDVIDCEGGRDTFTIEGIKFYDQDASGSYTAGDTPIAGWTIFLDDNLDYTDGVVATVVTDANGSFKFTNTGSSVNPGITVVPSLGAGTWYVYEGPAGSGTGWYQTLGGGAAVTGDPAPPPIIGATVGAYTVVLTIANPASDGNDFGNLRLNGGGGMTQGFWSNRVGETLFNTDSSGALALLNSLNLRDKGGALLPANFFTSYSAFRNWLKDNSDPNTSMLYKLSVQLAAMALNVHFQKVDGNALVYAPGCGNTGIDNNFITITDLIQAAKTQLGSPTSFTLQECLKDALDKANNNLNFVQGGP